MLGLTWIRSTDEYISRLKYISRKLLNLYCSSHTVLFVHVNLGRPIAQEISRWHPRQRNEADAASMPTHEKGDWILGFLLLASFISCTVHYVSKTTARALHNPSQQPLLGQPWHRGLSLGSCAGVQGLAHIMKTKPDPSF